MFFIFSLYAYSSLAFVSYIRPSQNEEGNPDCDVYESKETYNEITYYSRYAVNAGAFGFVIVRLIEGMFIPYAYHLDRESLSAQGEDALNEGGEKNSGSAILIDITNQKLNYMSV